MQVTVKSYSEQNDVFTLRAEDGVEFDVRAKHIPLDGDAQEPVDMIGRTFDASKVIKGLHTQAVKAADKAAQELAINTGAAYDRLIAAIAARQAAIPSRDNEITLSLLKSDEKAVKVGLQHFDASVIDNVIACQNVEKKGSDNFIAVKVNVKIVKTLAAIGLNLSAKLDSYTNSIMRNLAELQRLDNLNAQRSICKKIELDEMQQAAAVHAYHTCSPSTASTQASSTRMCMHYLDICNVRKGIKSDSISFNDSSAAKMMQAFYVKTA